MVSQIHCYPTNAVYVVVTKQQLQSVRALLGDDTFDMRETYLAQDKAADEAWSDPGDAEYDNYDAHLKTP